jgi:acyl carrier protein
MVILHQILLGALKGVTNMTNVSMDDINKLVSLQLGVRDVNETSLLAEELGAESADVVNIIAILEEKYQIVVKESEIAKICTPADLLSLVNGKLS